MSTLVVTVPWAYAKRLEVNCAFVMTLLETLPEPVDGQALPSSLVETISDTSMMMSSGTCVLHRGQHN